MLSHEAMDDDAWVDACAPFKRGASRENIMRLRSLQDAAIRYVKDYNATTASNVLAQALLFGRLSLQEAGDPDAPPLPER